MPSAHPPTDLVIPDPVRVLHVEDIPWDSSYIAYLLDEHDRAIALERVPSLAAAICELRHVDYDAMLVDLGLPDANGLDAVWALARVRADIPLVVLSCDDRPEISEGALAAFATDFFVKPLEDVEALAKALTTRPIPPPSGRRSGSDRRAVSAGTLRGR